ncbi:MAG: hypothetical protein E7370_01710 [Clostridiales bacterium]|nr:hypothetical protein [Clostridiales bacterium]
MKIFTKILTAVLSLAMLFSVVGFTACTNGDLQAKIAELEAQITELQEQNQDLQADITEQQTQITTQQEQIADLEQEIYIIKEQLNKNIIEQDVDDMIELACWSPAVSSLGNRITVNNSNKNVVIECATDKGYLIYGHEFVKQIETSSGETIYWSEGQDDIIGDFVEITLRYEETYVGYALVKVYIESNMFNATVIKSAIFPMVDGEYQNVTKNQVKNLLEKAEIEYTNSLSNKYNAILYSKANDLIMPTFLKENKVCGAYYLNPNYDENPDYEEQYIQDNQAPKSRTIIIDEDNINSIFKEDSLTVDFEREICILYIFSDVSPREYNLIEADVVNSVLTVKVKLEQKEENDASMPYQRCFVLKMNKTEFESIKFLELYGDNNENELK